MFCLDQCPAMADKPKYQTFMHRWIWRGEITKFDDDEKTEVTPASPGRRGISAEAIEELKRSREAIMQRQQEKQS